MKRIIALMLLIVAFSSFAACTGEKNGKSEIQPMEIEATLAVDTDARGVVQTDMPLENKRIILGNKEYDFPLVVSELIDDGWYFDENARERLEPIGANVSTELYDMNLYHDEYGMRLMLLSIRNDSDTEQELRDCRLTKIGINRSMIEDLEKVNIVLPGGVTFKSTAADVVDIYGTVDNKGIFYAVELNGSSADYIGELFCVNFTFMNDGTIEYICFS